MIFLLESNTCVVQIQVFSPLKNFFGHRSCFSIWMRLYLWLWFVCWSLSDFHLELSSTSRSLTEHLLSNALLRAHHMLEFVSVLGRCKMSEVRGKWQFYLYPKKKMKRLKYTSNTKKQIISHCIESAAVSNWSRINWRKSVESFKGTVNQALNLSVLEKSAIFWCKKVQWSKLTFWTAQTASALLSLNLQNFLVKTFIVRFNLSQFGFSMMYCLSSVF